MLSAGSSEGEMMSQNVLFFMREEKYVKEFLPLMTEVRRRGYRPVAAIDWLCSQEWLDALGREGIAYDRPSVFAKGAVAAKKGGTTAPRKTFSAVFSGLFRELRQLKVFVNTLARYASLRRLYRGFMERNEPVCVVCPSDKSLARLIPLAEARRRHAATLVVPTMYRRPEFDWNYHTTIPEFKDLFSDASLWNRCAALFFPKMVFVKDGIRLYRNSGGEAAAMALLGLYPPCPWPVGSSPLCDAVAVQNRYEADHLTAQGISSSRVTVTGKPQEDVIWDILSKDRLRVREELGIPPQAQVLVCSFPHYAEHEFLDWDRHWEENIFLAKTFSSISGVTVVASLYPRSDAQEYRRRLEPLGIVFPRRNNVYELMSVCDVFAANLFSTTLNAAVAAHCPSIAFDFILPDQHYSVFSEVDTGTVVVRDRAALHGAAERFFSDGAYCEEMRQRQVAGSQRLGVVDGKACSRIVDVIDRLVVRRCGHGK
jgi:hypothetical protein